MLVTGGAGFIGSNFILYWMRQHPDDEIVNLDKLTYAGNLENLLDVASNPQYRFLQGDICEPKDAQVAMDGIDKVVHFAAESHVDRAIERDDEFFRTNVLGTKVLLVHALNAGVKQFHHVSTDEVFGELPLDSTDKFDEKTQYHPRNPYSASKAASDHLVMAYHHTHGLPVTISNCSNNYGPYQFPEKFIPVAITNVLEGKRIPVYGDGKNVRDWLLVTDHCRAIDAILQQGRIGETYCIGGMTENASNYEVARKIAAFLGKDERCIEFVKDRKGHDRRYAIDWSKINRELGWKPEHDFDAGLEMTVQWYAARQDWWKRVKSGEYRQ